MRPFLIALLACGTVLSFPSFSAETADPPASRALDLARQLNEAFISVAEAVSPAVVVIEVRQKAGAPEDYEGDSIFESLPPDVQRRFLERGPSTGRGSGVVISEDGFILTNFHVVEDADSIKVRFKDGADYEAKVQGLDRESDIAVIKINKTGLTPAKIGDSTKTRVGEFVLAVGAPFELDYSVTFGHISAMGRSFETSFSMGQYVDQDFLQTDASINPGNSGGPLVNLYGEVVGINSMIRGMRTGIGFAIPINLAKTVSDRLIKEGKFTRSWLKVGIVALRENSELKAQYSEIADGVLLRTVFPDGPAGKAKLKQNDIVTAVNGKEIKTSRQLKEAVSIQAPGTTIDLDVVRKEEGKFKNLKFAVVTEALPEKNQFAMDSPRRELPVEKVGFGLTVHVINEELAEKYSLGEETSGVIVVAVETGSLAASKRVRVGDLITEVDGRAIRNPSQLKRLLNEEDATKGVTLSIQRNGRERTIVLKED